MEVTKILITGGAGFIGSNLIRYLNSIRKNKFEIYVIDNEIVGKKSDIKYPIKKFYKFDISKKSTFEKINIKFDAVIHLAAETEVVASTLNPSKTIKTNVNGTYNLFEFCRNKNIKKIIVASTGGAIIGNYNKTIYEDTTAKPISPYGLSKLFNENLAFTYNNTYGMNISCLRFANVYGPGSHKKNSVIAKFFNNIEKNLPIVIYGNGKQKRDFIYVDDISKGILKVLLSNKSGVFQFATGKTTSVNQLVKMMKNIYLNSKSIKTLFLPERAGEVFETKISNKKAKNELKFLANTKINIGLKKTLGFIRNL